MSIEPKIISKIKKGVVFAVNEANEISVNEDDLDELIKAYELEQELKQQRELGYWDGAKHAEERYEQKLKDHQEKVLKVIDDSARILMNIVCDYYREFYGITDKDNCIEKIKNYLKEQIEEINKT